MNNILVKSAVVCFSILAFTQTATARVFDEIIIFGDSLSDSGAYIGNADAGNGGRFTTNPGPVWTETLGAFYGLDVISNNPNNPRTSPTGNNYAQGGAQVTSPIGIGQTISPQNAIPIASQISNYLATSPAANPNGLYTVWGGANDLFFNAGQVGGGLAIPNAVDNMIASAFSLVGQVQRLSDAGAGTILVPNLPDVGNTPSVILKAISTVGAGNPNLNLALGTATVVLRTPANTPAEQSGVEAAAISAAEAALGIPAGFLSPAVGQTSALFTGLADAYNAGLEHFLSTTANTILLDVNSLFGDVISDPSAFGISNVTSTACNTPSSLNCTAPFFASPNAADEFLFADGVHPTTAGHTALATYAISTVEATSVPEPSVLFLLGPVFGFLAARRRKAA